jgi:hypothetical protein
MKRSRRESSAAGEEVAIAIAMSLRVPADAAAIVMRQRESYSWRVVQALPPGRE